MVVSFEAAGELQKAGRSRKWSVLPVTLTRDGRWVVRSIRRNVSIRPHGHDETSPVYMATVTLRHNYTALLT